MPKNNTEYASVLSESELRSLTDRIIFEDNHIIAVNKLPGEIVQGDKTGDLPLSEKIKAYIAIKYDKPGKVFLGVVHRLDRPVSGVVVFARTTKALQRMNALFREKDLQKRYWAVVEKAPEITQQTLVHYLVKNEKLNKSFAHLKPVPDGLKSELEYNHIASSDRYHLLEVQLFTGRHHQIRAQLASIGCIIKGDLKYGAKRSNPNGSIHLHSRLLEFTHPVTKSQIKITAAPPADPIWNYFWENRKQDE